jgi:hypothetical protein
MYEFYLKYLSATQQLTLLHAYFQVTDQKHGYHAILPC